MTQMAASKGELVENAVTTRREEGRELASVAERAARTQKWRDR